MLEWKELTSQYCIMCFCETILSYCDSVRLTAQNCIILLIDGVKGVGAQGSWPSTTKLVAWVDNGVGFIPWTPYVEGDEIKMKGDEIKREQGD